MIKSKKLCIRNTISKIIAPVIIAPVLFTQVYAVDVIVPEPYTMPDISDGDILIEPAQPVTLFSDGREMDFSLLDGSLTVEVPEECTDGTVLFVAEYDENGLLLNTHIIENVSEKNTVSVSGEYERAFLWDTDNGMSPKCESITTKCDYEITEGTDGEWEVSPDGHTLYNYIGDGTDVVIPNSYKGKRIYYVQNEPEIIDNKYLSVDEIYHYNIFNSRTDITSVKLSDGIKLIGNFAFAMCGNASCDIPLTDDVIAVGSYAYYGCKKMTGGLDLSEIKKMGTFVFTDCAALNGGLKLPRLSTIGQCDFYGCSSLTGSIELSESTVTIGPGAFYGCKNLTGGLDLSNISTLGILAFAECSGLNGGLTLPAIDTLPYGVFEGCGNLTGELTFPKSVENINDCAFYGCKGLTGGLDLSKMKALGEYAFYGCSGLNGELTLPALSTIPRAAFYGCSNMTGTLTIPEGVEVIDDFAFSLSGAGKLNALYLPSTLKKIGIGAFQYNSGLANELILPEGLEYIGDVAFNHCSKLSNTVLNIPSTVKTIGGDLNASENTGYGSHVFYDAFKKTTEFIADSGYFKSVDGVLYSSDMKRLVAYPPARTDTEFEIPEGVTQIDEMALGYSSIVNLTIPNSYIMSEVIPANVINQMANNLAVALYHNHSVKNVFVKDSNENYSSVDGILYSKDLKDLWYVPSKKTGTVEVLDGTENIKKGAFYIEYKTGGETYTGVYIPASVKYIDSENLISINLRPLADIAVDGENKFYTVENGRLKAK